MWALDARVGIRENQIEGERAEKVERGGTQDKKSRSCEFACRSCPTSSCPALPSFLEERVMYMLEGKLVLTFIFWNHKCNESDMCVILKRKLVLFFDRVLFVLCGSLSLSFFFSKCLVHFANLFPWTPLTIYRLFKWIWEEAIVINKALTWAINSKSALDCPSSTCLLTT